MHTMAATSQLSFLLTHRLTTDEEVASQSNSDLLLQVLQTHELVKRAEREAAEGNEKTASVLHRWILRVTSLITTSKSNLAQAAGFALALETSKQSQTLFLQHSKNWYTAALALVSRKAAPSSSDLTISAIDLLLFCYEKALYSTEYAREVANAAGVRKSGEALVAIAGLDSADAALRSHAIASLCCLLAISASPLRPLSQQMQNLSVHLLCSLAAEDTSNPLKRGAVHLLSHLYITAGKAQAGQTWRRTVESLIGSSHALISVLASTLVEEYSPPLQVAPLDMPPIASTSNDALNAGQVLLPTLERLESVFDILVYMLSTATERSVPVPIGLLVQLTQRLLTLTSASPVKERTDGNLNLQQLALLPRLHLQACRLLGQLVQSTGTYITAYGTQLLAQLAFAQESYPCGSPTKVSFYAVASLLVQSTPIHTEEGGKSVSKIVRAVLQDAAVLVDTSEGTKAVTNQVADDRSGQGRKNKRPRLFEDNQAGGMGGRQRLAARDVEVVRHGLTSLQRILSYGAYLLPPNLINLTLRLLLAFSISPNFFTAVPSFFTSSTAPDALTEALSLCPGLRATVLRCLLAALQSTAKEASGYIEHCINVFRNGVLVSDGQEREVCREGLAYIDSLVRPAVPPLIRTAALDVALAELSGGPIRPIAKRAAEEEEQRKDVTGESSEDLALRHKEAARPQFVASEDRSKSHSDRSAAPTPRATTAAIQAAQVESIRTSATTSSQEQPVTPAVQDLQTSQPPRGAVRPPPPPIESIDGSTTAANLDAEHSSTGGLRMPTTEFSITSQSVSADVTMADEPAPAGQTGLGTPVAGESVTATVPFRRGGDADSDSDDDDDDDAPLPKIVMTDDEDEG